MLNAESQEMDERTKTEILLRRTLVGVKLKQWRMDAELSQNDVAKSLDYSGPQFISNWERGLSLPPLEVLSKLVDLYSISADVLIETVFAYQEQYLEYQYSHLLSALKRANSKK